MSFLRGGNAPGSTNSCPDNKKKVQKTENSKKKKKILANHPHPLVSSYDFFLWNIHTCITWESNWLPQASRLPSLPPHYIITYDSMRYAISLY